MVEFEVRSSTGADELWPVTSEFSIRSPLLAFFRAAKRSFSFFSLAFSSRRTDFLLSLFPKSSSSTSECGGGNGVD